MLCPGGALLPEYVFRRIFHLRMQEKAIPLFPVYCDRLYYTHVLKYDLLCVFLFAFSIQMVYYK